MLDFNIPFRRILGFLGRTFVWGFVLPWIAFALLAVVARFAATAVRAIRATRAALIETAYCPRGHESELHGIFECRCGALFAGWAFERCPVCNESSGYVPCEHCGLAVRNPVLVAIEPRRWI